jgi:hypothetical protein
MFGTSNKILATIYTAVHGWENIMIFSRFSAARQGNPCRMKAPVRPAECGIRTIIPLPLSILKHPNLSQVHRTRAILIDHS